MRDRKPARRALIYLSIAVGAALLFLLAASVYGDYLLDAMFGGAAWVSLFSLIACVPLVLCASRNK